MNDNSQIINLLPWLFSLVIIANLGLKLYLNHRQSKSIKAHINSVPDSFASRITLDDHQKSAHYNLAKLRVSNYHNIVLDSIVILMTLGGGINAICNLVYGLNIGVIWQNIALVICFNLILGIVEEPFNLYSIFQVEAKFGFNKMTFNTYLVDHVKGVILSLIFAVPLLYIILWVMSDFNKLWWLYTFFILAGFNLLLMSIYPNIIAPLFNKFTPLTDTELKGKIDVLLSKCGFISNGVFVMDGSKRSNHGNAYFTGFGKNKRIVFYDTLLNNLTHDEVLAVLAHELGHFSKKHIINQMAFMFSMIFVVLYVLHLMMNQDWFYALFNISYFNNACALVGFIILSSFLSLPFAPIYNLLARKHEFEADHYAKQNSDKKDLISGLVKLYKDNASTLTPDSLYVKFYYSHPPASMRIAKLEE